MITETENNKVWEVANLISEILTNTQTRNVKFAAVPLFQSFIAILYRKSWKGGRLHIPMIYNLFAQKIFRNYKFEWSDHRIQQHTLKVVLFKKKAISCFQFLWFPWCVRSLLLPAGSRNVRKQLHCKKKKKIERSLPL